MDRILIADCGSQYTQLIARRVREAGVYCEIHPFHKLPAPEGFRGLIVSGSPSGVNDPDAPKPDLSPFIGHIPVLGICYGAQFISHTNGGRVAAGNTREYGRSEFSPLGKDPLFAGIDEHIKVWMSHGDSILSLPSGARLLGSTPNVKNAAFRLEGAPVWGLQFHPEVHHSQQGELILENFVKGICGCAGDWTSERFVEETVASLRETIGEEDEVILGLSGGVDSSVAALLLHRAVGDRLRAVFVDSGLMRENEFEQVLEAYRGMGLSVEGVRASEAFLSALKGVEEPEQKRKIIGREYIRAFDSVAAKYPKVKYLAQGTIYPDVIESAPVKGPSATIKSHHNVGGLPKDMKLKVVEPLRLLFKDEVRRVGKTLGLVPDILYRHPFPGPGLGIRVLGEVTEEKLEILRKADSIYTAALHSYDLYDKIWQAGAILLPVRSVGVMGDERSYGYTVALRAVTSVDGMTADWYHFPHEFLAAVSNDIINRVAGVNRVVYDISSKPPATIEWE